MIFNHHWMLWGLFALAVPILIHLLNRSRAKVLDWGAMRFLLASLTSQNRRLLIEEIILLALRCLLVALIALAVARPFLPTRSSIPWPVVLPAFLGAVICFGVAAAMWGNRRARIAVLAGALALTVLAALATTNEEMVQKLRWAAGPAEADVAVLIDSSMSMTVLVGGRSNFKRALAEARSVVGACRPGDAVSVILAGPVPRAIIKTPTADREKLLTALEALAPMGGTMNVLEGLNVAAASLAEGNNGTKKIVLITDGQNVGWDVRSDLRWRFLAEGLKKLPVPPRIICRILPMPKTVRNAAIEDVTFSRKVVGTDRPVKISVKLANTGTLTVKPSAVELSVDGAVIATEKVVTEILPRAAETIQFEHRFTRSGPRLVSARLVVRDDLPSDNAAERVVNVIEKLDVLIVDGTPSTRPLGGAAAFIDIALTPRGEDDADSPPPPDKPKKPKDPDAIRYLVQPKVVAAPDIAAVTNFAHYSAVILANVPMLPESVAKGLVAFVQNGGGLLIAPGIRVKPTFYNAWKTAGAEPVLPARLVDRKSVPDAPVRLVPKSFRHPALQLLVDSAQADLASALVKNYWDLEADETDNQVRVGGRLGTGRPFVVERRLGKGYVLLIATSLDHKGSNLPALKSFVPMVHELVYFLAAPLVLDSNVAPGSAVLLELRDAATAGSAIGTGLRGAYYGKTNFTDLRATRVDPTINFNWGNRKPHEQVHHEYYSVRWSGWVRPLYSERYTFHATADDGVRLWVDDRLLIDGWKEQSAARYEGAIDLAAGRRAKLRLEYYQGKQDATIRLEWSSRRQRRETIPARQLYPGWADASLDMASGGGDGQGSVGEVLTPSGRRLPARLRGADGLLRVDFSQTQEPGLYTLSLPDELAKIYAPGGAGVPFVVLTKIEESFLDGLTDADLDLTRQHVALFTTERTDELTSRLVGGVPGEELWKYLVLGALMVLVAEIAVTRWIATQRRLHAPETIVFGAEAVDVQTFRDRAKHLLTVPQRPAEVAPKT